MTCTQLERSAAAVVAAKVAAVAAAMEEEEEEDRAAAAAAALVAGVVGDRLPMLHLEGDSLFFFFTHRHHLCVQCFYRNDFPSSDVLWQVSSDCIILI